MQTLAQLTGISGEVDVGPVQAAGDAEALLQRVWVAEPIVWHRCSGRKAGWKSLAGKAGQTTLCKAAGGSLQCDGRSVSGGCAGAAAAAAAAVALAGGGGGGAGAR